MGKHKYIVDLILFCLSIHYSLSCLAETYSPRLGVYRKNIEYDEIQTKITLDIQSKPINGIKLFLFSVGKPNIKKSIVIGFKNVSNKTILFPTYYTQHTIINKSKQTRLMVKAACGSNETKPLQVQQVLLSGDDLPDSDSVIPLKPKNTHYIEINKSAYSFFESGNLQKDCLKYISKTNNTLYTLSVVYSNYLTDFGLSTVPYKPKILPVWIGTAESNVLKIEYRANLKEKSEKMN